MRGSRLVDSNLNMFFVKSLVKRCLTLCGYELRPLAVSREAAVDFPFVESYNLRYKGASRTCTFDFWIANGSALQWYKDWFYAADNPTWELDEFASLVQPGDRVLEIGCHHGFLTLMLLHCVGTNGFVLAIDALPENVLITQAQLSLNRAGACGIAQHCAGGAQPGFTTVERRTNTHIVHPEASGIRVPVVTGDMLDQQYGPFNVLKIDVEGFEAEVLKGCARLLERRPKVIIELHPEFMSQYGYNATVEDVFALLDADRYEGTMIVRPAFADVRPFVPSDVPRAEVSNVHLRPRG